MPSGGEDQPWPVADVWARASSRALACRHDNLDCCRSAHHHRNTLRVGPGRDMVGKWERAARVVLNGGGPTPFIQPDDTLHLKLPPADPGRFVPGLRIEGSGLV